MNSDLVRIAIIGAVALALYYLVTNNTALQNQGEVAPDVGLPEGYQQQVTSTPAIPSASSLPNYQPAVVKGPSPMPSNFAQPAVQAPPADTQAYVFQPAQEPARAAQLNVVKQNTNVLPYPQVSNNYGPQQANVLGQFGIKTGAQPSLDCFPKDTVTPQELMPREDPNSSWNQVNPSVGGHLSDRNFLESGYLYGIDSQSSSLKNPNLQLRSDPLIPQIAVGPWSQSTYGPDTNHRQFEIGGDY